MSITLSPGTRLGVYEVLDQIGQGGMGAVFRARDTQLGRVVALKTLPAEFASDPERVRRFDREATTLAALNHPHIAHVYGVETTAGPSGSGVRAIAMEFVEGQDLSTRIGSLPAAEALRLAAQIAEALEAAHDAGIVHRDLKPANVRVTPTGVVKVLDFGIAKSVEAQGALGATTSMATVPGTRIGTAGYMSPEQLRGQEVDKRTDVWAFGCVLFEMLAGRRVFGGATASDAAAASLEREPDWTALPAATPATRSWRCSSGVCKRTADGGSGTSGTPGS